MRQRSGKHLSVTLYEETDDVWIASCSELPDCTGRGASPEEALDQFLAAVRACLQADPREAGEVRA